MTTIECLQALQEPYKSQAIKNLKEQHQCAENAPQQKVSDGLFEAFSWSNTPEGAAYWNDKYNDLVKLHL